MLALPAIHIISTLTMCHSNAGDRHRWEQLKKWLPLHPHVFRRQVGHAWLHDAWLHDAWVAALYM